MSGMGLTVGQLAQRSGLSPKAIRLYERQGLLLTAKRTETGYRVFDADELGVLRFIRQAKAIGLRLREIKEVLDLQRSGKQTCERVVALLDSHIAEIDRALDDLHSLRHTLADARAAARDSQRRQEDAVVCQIIEGYPTAGCN
jgi:MerR family copper efflux transcriptional regulator